MSPCSGDREESDNGQTAMSAQQANMAGGSRAEETWTSQGGQGDLQAAGLPPVGMWSRSWWTGDTRAEWTGSVPP